MWERPSWYSQPIPCRGITELFYPNQLSSEVAKAKAVCNGTPTTPRCRWRQECIHMAIENHEGFGVWGGMSERDRRKIQRARNKYHDKTIYTLEDVKFPHVTMIRPQRTIYIKRRLVPQDQIRATVIQLFKNRIFITTIGEKRTA